jgi:hypothetical protein
MKLVKYFFIISMISALYIQKSNAQMNNMEGLNEAAGASQMQEMMDQGEEEIEPRMIFYKKKYEAEFDNFFDDVWNVCLEVLKSKNCMVAQKNNRQTDEGLYKGKVVSEYCAFAQVEAEEDVYDSLMYYSTKVPVIRGGVWDNGRIQYKIILKETEEETVTLLLKGEISGKESNVTNEVHFWESSGWFEHHLLEEIKERLAKIE